MVQRHVLLYVLVFTVGQVQFVTYASPSFDAEAPVATGNLTLAVKPRTPTCLPSRANPVALELLSCFRFWTVAIQGNQLQAVAVSQPPDTVFPCQFLSLQGNLTGSTQARVICTLDELGTQQYTTEHPDILDKLYVNSVEELVDEAKLFLFQYLQTSEYYEPLTLARALLADLGDHSGPVDDVHMLDKSPKPFREASVLYRNKYDKVFLKNPGSCRLKYEVSAGSRILLPQSHGDMAAWWRLVYLIVAAMSVSLACVGVALCIFFSRRHAEYLISHYAYMEVCEELEKKGLSEQVLGKKIDRAATAAAAERASTSGTAQPHTPANTGAPKYMPPNPTTAPSTSPTLPPAAPAAAAAAAVPSPPLPAPAPAATAAAGPEVKPAGAPDRAAAPTSPGAAAAAPAAATASTATPEAAPAPAPSSKKKKTKGQK